jgi:nitrogen fixation protein FixH
MNQTLTGRHVLLWLTAFFGVVIATNIVFITAAVETLRGEDQEKPYLQGISFNRTLAERAEQAGLGWQASLAARRLPSGQVVIDLHVHAPDHLPERGLKLAGTLRHPVDEHLDRNFTFREVMPGLYQGSVDGVKSGHWDVMARTETGAPFEASRRLWVP